MVQRRTASKNHLKSVFSGICLIIFAVSSANFFPAKVFAEVIDNCCPGQFLDIVNVTVSVTDSSETGGIWLDPGIMFYSVLDNPGIESHKHYGRFFRFCLSKTWGGSFS